MLGTSAFSTVSSSGSRGRGHHTIATLVGDGHRQSLSGGSDRATRNQGGRSTAEQCEAGTGAGIGRRAHPAPNADSLQRANVQLCNEQRAWWTAPAGQLIKAETAAGVAGLGAACWREVGVGDGSSVSRPFPAVAGAELSSLRGRLAGEAERVPMETATSPARAVPACERRGGGISLHDGGEVSGRRQSLRQQLGLPADAHRTGASSEASCTSTRNACRSKSAFATPSARASDGH
jgi:hypothetical protein